MVVVVTDVVVVTAVVAAAWWAVMDRGATLLGQTKPAVYTREARLVGKGTLVVPGKHQHDVSVGDLVSGGLRKFVDYESGCWRCVCVWRIKITGGGVCLMY